MPGKGGRRRQGSGSGRGQQKPVQKPGRGQQKPGRRHAAGPVGKRPLSYTDMPRVNLKIARRVLEVFNLKIQGLDKRQIVERLDVTSDTIRADLNYLRQLPLGRRLRTMLSTVLTPRVLERSRKVAKLMAKPGMTSAKAAEILGIPHAMITSDLRLWRTKYSKLFDVEVEDPMSVADVRNFLRQQAAEAEAAVKPRAGRTKVEWILEKPGPLTHQEAEMLRESLRSILQDAEVLRLGIERREGSAEALRSQGKIGERNRVMGEVRQLGRQLLLLDEMAGRLRRRLPEQDAVG